MSTNRSRRIDRAAAEHLLSGHAVDAQGGQGALADLLAAAAAPATEAELAGEEAAMTAFREAARLNLTPDQQLNTAQLNTAPTSPSPTTRSRPMASCPPQRSRAPRKRAGTRFVGARAVVAAFAVTALGGVAVAAGTGHLPEVLGGSPQHTPSENAAASALMSAGSTTGGGGAPSGGQPTPHSTSPAAVRPAPGSSAPGTSADGTPGSPSAGADALLPLCKLWQQGSTDPRFEPLTRAAGGSDRVRAYCADLKKQSDEATPSASAKATDGGGQGKPDPNPSHGKPDPTPSADPSKTKADPVPTPSGGGNDGRSHPSTVQSSPADGHRT
ncbi:hypothetical protein [Kitasatospora azatica]|uniref:hypothetical protein n=1 Tax=Kitasatospora azatica TaxID=58347 RepID=UPI00056AEE2B|nr:hypothetical protein [Kitasatospora azatica]